MADSKQTSGHLRGGRYLKKGQHSSCGSAGAPCAVVLGLGKNALEQGQRTLHPFIFLSSVIIHLPGLFYKALLSLRIPRESFASCLSAFDI